MSLFKNAIDSIQAGVEDYLTQDSKRYLSAIRNIAAGILLLYKEKLHRLSPPEDNELLIKKKILPKFDDNGDVFFASNGSSTVNVQEIQDRFKSLNIDIDWKKFKTLNDLRNKIEHYYTDESADVIREIIAASFILIRDFLCEYLEEDPRECLGEKCWQALLEIKDVYEKEQKICQQSLEAIDWKYSTLRNSLNRLRCPSCYSNLVKSDEQGEYRNCELLCSSCGYEFYGSDVVEQCLSETFAFECYVAMKHGGYNPLSTCPDCDQKTYMHSENICANCEYEMEYTQCHICSESLSLYDQGLDGLCGYCYHLMSKDD